MKIENRKKLGDVIKEYKEKNTDNKYKPVAVGRYGIRKREDIYSKELAKDYSKNKLIYKNTLTVGMGSKQIDIGILTEDEIYAVSPAYHTFRINNIDANYLRYCLDACNADMSERFMIASARQGKSVDFKKMLEYEIPVYSESDTQTILYNLSKIENIILNLDSQLEKMELLVKSRFIEMFGDPVENEKGWEMIPLSELGTCKNGMNFASDEDGIEIAYLGVGDFKDNSRIDGVSGLSQISLNTMPSEEYLLKDEDIVFVRSNGSKELVGRCLAVYPGNEKLTFSGFCIRWRKNSDKVMTDFLLQVLKTENVRILMRGRGANIQNLNQQILGKLMIPVPNMALQQSFVEFVGAIDKSKFVERFPELSVFFKACRALYDEMICIFPYFCPCEIIVREIREISF